MTTVTSREFNRDVSAAKRAAAGGPVVITDNGRPAHVLMTIRDFERLTERAGRMAERLAGPTDDLPLDERRATERTSTL